MLHHSVDKWIWRGWAAFPHALNWQDKDCCEIKYTSYLNTEYHRESRYFIMHSGQCEASLCFWHSVFHDTDWIQQSQWQTAGRLMRVQLRQQNQLMESSRWGALWPEMIPNTWHESTVNSFNTWYFPVLIIYSWKLIIIPYWLLIQTWKELNYTVLWDRIVLSITATVLFLS